MPAPSLDLLDSIRAFPALKSLRTPEAPKKPKTAGDYALKAALVLGRPIGLALEEIGDVLSRPVTALSEGYGAYEKDRDPLEAALRGFTKGPSKARYPTFGERLVPEEEGEGVGRKALRVGAEILTDPTTYVGPGLVKGVGKIAVKGAKLAAGTRIAKTAAKSDAAQALSRLLLPMGQNLKYGGAPGAVIGKLAERGEMAADAMLDAELEGFLSVLKNLKLTGKKNAARRIKAAEVLETGVRSGDMAVDNLADFLGSRLQTIGSTVKNFRDRTGAGFKIRTAAGESIPFNLLKNYYPQMLNDEALKAAMSQRGLSEQAKKLAKMMNITDKEAKLILEEQLGTVKRAGHIEYARELPVPRELLERDPAKVFPKYASQTLRRVAMAKEFGVEHGRLAKLLDKAVEKGLSEKTASDVRRLIESRRAVSAIGMEKIAPSILGAQVITKMGPTSSITNLSQNVNTVVAEGLGNYIRGLSKLTRDPEVRHRAVQAFHQGLRSQLEQMTGSSLGYGTGFLGDYGPRGYLRAVGFTGVERGNRMAAYAAGLASAERLVQQAGGKITPRLKAMGVLPKDLTAFARTGKFLPEAESRIGLAAAKRTQFTTKWTDLPPLWQTPEMRIAMQFKNFIYQQSRFVTREIMVPAAKYFETGGKEGDIGPLVRAMIAYPIAGQGVAALRDLFQEQTANLIGAKRKKPRKFDEKHPVGQMLQDSMYVGAFGMAGDVLQQASRGRLVQWALGPTVSDVTENLEFGARHVMAGKFPKTDALLARLYRHMPGRRVLPLEPSEIAGADLEKGYLGQAYRGITR